MSISSSANDRKPVAVTRARESSSIPITLSEWSSNGVAIIRIFVGYLWFQQLFWKMPPDFTGLYSYIIRESQHTIIPGYGYILQHTFLSGCTSLHNALALAEDILGYLGFLIAFHYSLPTKVV